MTTLATAPADAFDKPSELTEEEIYRYAEEGAGNRLLERIDTFAGVSQPYTYNATGAPIQRGQLRYEYDAKEQLTALYRDEQLLARYAYNGFGERIRKVVYSQGRRPTITYFLYSGSTLVAEADESGEITAQYQYLEDHRPVLMLQGKQAFVIHTDHLGTPRVVSDEQGEIRWQASYTPFGKAIITQSDVNLPLRFPGQYADAESGTHYNYLRDYDPELGRYLRSDPIGLGGGLNTYAYVAGNPLGAIDPLGLQAQPAVVDLPNVSDEVRRIVNQRGLRGLVDTTGRVAANQPIPPPRPGVPATSVLRGLTRVNALVTIATVSFTLGHEGAALADALYFAPADHAEVLAHIRRYDPDYSPTGTALQVDREGIRALGSELLRAQGDFLIANANSCTPAVETTQLWYDANWAINGTGALPPVPLSQQQIDDLAYEDYKANGGTLTRDDWEIEGKPDGSPEGLIGVAFENYLERTLGGEGSFSVGGREFDGRVGDRWYEAKSGRYWQDQAAPGIGFDKFKSDMGTRLSIARNNGATYELHSNTPIPDYVKEWLTQKGIPYFEHL